MIIRGLSLSFGVRGSRLGFQTKEKELRKAMASNGIHFKTENENRKRREASPIDLPYTTQGQIPKRGGNKHSIGL